MLLPATFDWRREWPVGTRLRLGDRGEGVITEHRHTGPVFLFDEPWPVGRGDWRRPLPRFEDVVKVGA